MADITTPVPSGTDIGKTIAGYLVGLGITWDSAGAEILGLLTASPEANSISGRLKTIADKVLASIAITAAALPLPAGASTDAKSEAIRALLAGVINVAVSALPLPAGASTDAKSEAIRALLAGTLGISAAALPLPAGAATDASVVAIATAIQNQRVEQLFVDDAGTYYVRVDKGAAGVIYTDLAGNTLSGATITAAQANGMRPASGSPVQIDKTSFTATATATGYSAGDFVDHFLTIDGSNGVVVGNFWINLTTGAKLVSGPSNANLAPYSPLASGAASTALQTTGNSSLATIATLLAGTLAISAASLPLPAGAASDAKSEAIRALLAGTLAISAAALPLPAGAATDAKLETLRVLLAGTLNAALGASENRIGAVGGLTAVPIAAVTRPANTTAYATGQLIANSTTAGTVAPLALAVARINGGTGSVRRVRLSSSRAGPGTDVVRVHLFKGSAVATPPTTTVGDGGTFAAATNLVGAIHLGYADVTLSLVGSDGSKGIAAPAVGGEVSFDTWAGQQTIYALLEARSAITPASGETLTVALETLRD